MTIAQLTDPGTNDSDMVMQTTMSNTDTSLARVFQKWRARTYQGCPNSQRGSRGINSTLADKNWV